ncbi:unnamed protein product [Nesidiocoris tenuis]|uniref:Uncharacterized protein n=1 Tax=Nesidiocoris tenuis TaxID=355587 RepID=A0A6H5HJW4_9HEMI|nr:unnamed protein product [Nesidiocoris tenuis]
MFEPRSLPPVPSQNIIILCTKNPIVKVCTFHVERGCVAVFSTNDTGETGALILSPESKMVEIRGFVVFRM